MATKYLEPYNPRAYVPGGSSKKKATAIQTQGRISPVIKRSNPYTHPLPGGGSGAVAPPMARGASMNRTGVEAQINQQVNRPPVQTGFSFNYESDPVLARIRALGSQNVGNAKTEAAALRKKAILDTGLGSIGREIGIDEPTARAAETNPISLMSELARQFSTRSRDLDESLNQQNLFWSGHRANQLGELSTNRGLAEAEIARDLRAALGGIDQGVLQAEEAAALREQEELERVAAEQEAAAMQQAYFDSLAIASGAAPNVPDPVRQAAAEAAYGPGAISGPDYQPMISAGSYPGLTDFLATLGMVNPYAPGLPTTNLIPRTGFY